MNELEEGMLAIGARLAPDDRTGIGLNFRAVALNPFAVRFHVELLQIGRQTGETLVIGDDSACRIAAEIAVPDTDQAHGHGQILIDGRRAEMFIHRMRAGKEMAEILRADGDHQRQADGRPY